MSEFVSCPGFPQKRVRTVLCGDCDRKIITLLNQYFERVIVFEKNPFLDSRVSFHTDLNVFHKGENEIILSPYQKKLYEALSDMGMKAVFSKSEVRSPYPYDCRLNCAVFPGWLFLNKAADESVLSFAEEKELKLLPVRQGYCKCSILLVNEKAFITDNEGIFNSATENGFRCLLVEKGDVRLQGFDYGFIGGSGSLIDKNLLLFFGDITKHRNYLEIKDFLLKEGCSFVFEEGLELSDIGGIVPLIY